jgi:phosphatidylglycerol lysyltransferase
MSARKATRPARAAPAGARAGTSRLPAWAAKAAGTINSVASSKLARTVVTLAILAIAGLLIRGELKTARLADIGHAIASTPPWAIAACAGCTVATYLCEAVIEWYVLRFIGKPLPLGRTILAASGASALSIAMGFGLASGTAARLRFYAFAKLSAADVAKVTGLVSAAIFATGLVTLGLSGLGGQVVIGKVLHWPPWGVLALSLALLLLIPAWFVALSRWRGHDGAIDVKARVLCLAAGLGNWIFQGAAMFVISAHAITGLPGFLAAFCLGSLIGSTLGVPADLGVLEATVLGSHALGAAHQGAAALVLFRVIFQLIPLILATGAVFGRQVLNLTKR